MSPQPHGISRTTVRFPLPKLEGGLTEAALRKDIETLREALGKLHDHVDQDTDIAVRRINEMILSGTLAQRPTAGKADRVYLATDQAVGSNLFFDTGAAWVLV